MTRNDDRTTARRILDAAAEILGSEGYASLSMRRVAAAAGISQAAIYRHFADKSELVSELVSEGYGELSARIEELAASGGDPALLIASSFRGYVEYAAERPALFTALLLQDIGPAGEAIEALGPGVSRKRRTFELLTALLRRGMEEGRFAEADPELSAQALWAGVFGLASRLVIERVGPERRAALVRRQIEILVRGLQGPSGREERLAAAAEGRRGKERKR